MTAESGVAPDVPGDDRGLTLGDGLFETLLAVDAMLIDFEAHLARLCGGASALGLPAPDPAAVRSLCQQAVSGRMGRLAVRLTYTAGSGGRGLDRPLITTPRLLVSVGPAPAPLGPVALATSRVRRNAASPASRWKTLSYLDNVLARREALAAGAQEAVMLNTDGHVACAAAANLFWLERGTLCTPSLDCGVLEGVMRGRVLRRAADLGLSVAEVQAPEAALQGAKTIFITNSLIGLRQASSLDGRALDVETDVVRALSLGFMAYR
jgi:branched-subunit amino acid aminotransferase/4-amino-4-deoxychorismate lyase